jgi:hypothetical protein
MQLISGGQTGVDRAALDVALELGIPCFGWCPKGRRSEDGSIPGKYPLQETPTGDYRQRGGEILAIGAWLKQPSAAKKNWETAIAHDLPAQPTTIEPA